jgi:hypothetical protein
VSLGKGAAVATSWKLLDDETAGDKCICQAEPIQAGLVLRVIRVRADFIFEVFTAALALAGLNH